MPNHKPMPMPALRQHLCETGASAVEFALVAPLFFLLIFSIVDFGMMMFANLTMQHAVREGARYAITGQSNLDPSAGAKQRYLAVEEKIRSSSLGIYKMSGATISTLIIPPVGSGIAQASGAGMYGSAGELVEIHVDCSWPLLTPVVAAFFKSTGGKYNFRVAATMRNEAF
ncbi:TadE/TadG family type IV pilus assembly protein [Cupriavidus sp. BIC8F]|uniref:TadE/TadG family type IV pilus assembly protein n=1 Tax=Cupriavidus sp. BIC8F TaxID=3079014 RepID=UPI00291688BA|nr:TadE/TadG family type IV pilus assembly protein [Cupriavidus sp. BIC8F]